MRMFYLSTKHGHRYFIHENGNIERTDMSFVPSGQWKLVGIVSTSGRKRFVPFGTLASWIESQGMGICDGSTFRFKNGNPRWTVRDFDHGTLREWGDGITDLRRLAVQS